MTRPFLPAFECLAGERAITVEVLLHKFWPRIPDAIPPSFFKGWCISSLAMGWLNEAAPWRFYGPKPPQRACLHAQCSLCAAHPHRSSSISLMDPFPVPRTSVSSDAIRAELDAPTQ